MENEMTMYDIIKNEDGSHSLVKTILHWVRFINCARKEKETVFTGTILDCWGKYCEIRG